MIIDTLAIAKKLKDAGYTPQQAEAQAELWSDIVDSGLTTQQNLKDTEAALLRDLKETEYALRRDLKEMDVKITQVEASLKRDVKDVEIKIAQTEANLRRDIKELELKNEKSHSDTQTRIWQVGLGFALFIISALTFLQRFLGHA